MFFSSRNQSRGDERWTPTTLTTMTTVTAPVREPAAYRTVQRRCLCLLPKHHHQPIKISTKGPPKDPTNHFLPDHEDRPSFNAWDVSNVQDASRMFKELNVYNQSLCAENVCPIHWLRQYQRSCIDDNRATIVLVGTILLRLCIDKAAPQHGERTR